MKYKSESSYELRTIVRASGAPPRRIRNWCEQGILKPVPKRGASGGRRRFDVQTVVKAAILNELRQLIGSAFRPGDISDVVASWDQNSPEWHLIDRGRDPGPVLLVFQREDKALHCSFLGPQDLERRLKRRKAAVVLDLTAITAKVRDGLER